ncbi:MAG: hypothetical protein WB297_03350 [Actinomycetota bacterium]
MRVGVLGTGTVGRTIVARLVEPDTTSRSARGTWRHFWASTEPNQITQETFADWHASNTHVGLGSFAEAAEHGELVVNATNGAGSLEALHGQRGESRRHGADRHR